MRPVADQPRPVRGMQFNAIQAAPFGAMGVRVEDDVIAELVFLEPGVQAQAPTDALSREACSQIAAFLEDPRHVFDLPLKPLGTDFQRRVGRAISATPCYRVVSSNGFGGLSHHAAGFHPGVKRWLLAREQRGTD